ncbi:hypothetical protein [Staphylococcus pseudintermedius]|uniref:hypothetical protein n=1 Tax=Staphylococcus pseudintermedius TaxID=283734 RepID=UPI00286D932D|nr:hypothetical protein [Staphylococcus pseudintermedius]WMZ52606.1 hypothetical protein QS421_11460 [Staphylococcus pseudintermedius]
MKKSIKKSLSILLVIGFIFSITIATIESSKNESKAANGNHYVVYKVTNSSPRGSFTYTTSDVYLTSSSAKKFAANNSMSVKTALINVGLGILPGNYATLFATSKSVQDVVVPKTIYNTANKNKGVHLRFEKGNVVNISPWNGSPKTATNSIKPFKKGGVKQTVKILKKG